MGATVRACELCKHPASLYCDSDSAFLCHSCDSAVHQANFLVARHLRHPLCSNCTSLCPCLFSGNGITPPDPALCSSCSPPNDLNVSSSLCSSSTSSSACISTAESSAVLPPVKKIRSRRNQRKAGAGASSSSVTDVSCQKSNRRIVRQRGTASVIGAKSKGVIASWCSRLGMGEPESASFQVIWRRVLHLLALSRRESTTLPPRVSLAAAVWLAVRSRGCGDRRMVTRETLRRVEMVSGVPGKLIIGAAGKVARAARPTKAQPVVDLHEGWAECSV